MTEKQINEQLVEDINRILTITGEWGQYGHLKTKTCKERERAIEAALNAGHNADLAAILDGIVESCTGKVCEETLSKYYIKYVCTLLHYRDEAARVKKLADIHKPNAAYELEAYLKEILKYRTSENTATGYRALELAGSPEALQAAIEAATGKKIKLTIANISDPSYVYREKEPYLSHRIWATTQMMPVICINFQKEVDNE